MKYHVATNVAQAIAWAQTPADHMRALLVSGAPGTGKTALAEHMAGALGAASLYALLHPWSGADDLFCGVSVVAAVAGDADAVHQPGVLALAAEASQRGRVVVCLDELDKAPETVECLLLDWLQSGRVPVKPGHHLLTNASNVVVVLTTNGQRAHGDALLRRCRRLRLAPLPEDVRVALVAERTGAPVGVVRLLDRACHKIAAADMLDSLSLQEVERATAEAWALATSAADVAEVLRAWAARGDAGAVAVDSADVRRYIAAVWGEIVVARRRTA